MNLCYKTVSVFLTLQSNLKLLLEHLPHAPSTQVTTTVQQFLPLVALVTMSSKVRKNKEKNGRPLLINARIQRQHRRILYEIRA